MSHTLLTDRETRILNLLREKSYGFNELCDALSGHTSRQTLKKDLKNLLEMQLIRVKTGRRGQKHVIELTETLNKFEEKAKCLKMMWEDHFSKLEQLEKHVKYGFISQKEAGSMLAWLVYEALPLLASGLIESQLPSEAKERLLSFSADRFCSHWVSILHLGKKYPEIKQGFLKGCKELAAHVKPVEEKIVNKFEQLAKLEHKRLSKV